MGAKLIRGRLVILNFMCQIDWGMDIWLNTIIGMSVGVAG